jgi:uncharacterized protein
MRDAGNFSPGYNMEAMKAGLIRNGGRFSLFGGEPLLMPIPDLEEIFKFGLETYGGNGMQTNGTLITREHIDLFRKYKAHVGISMDGPEELNDSRWMGSTEATRLATEKSMDAIRALSAAGRPPSLIVTLYKGNATSDRLPRLVDWMEELSGLGVNYINLHLLEVDDPGVRETMVLSTNEAVAALITLRQLQKTTKLVFDTFDDMRELLTGKDEAGTLCIWNACDTYTTPAVRGIDGLGNDSNCGRTNKDGVSWGKAEKPGYERQILLHYTPYEDGGCKDCKFFFACKGQCPGTAIDGDWRNRSEHCQIWYRTFEHLERELIAEGVKPLTITGESVKVEEAMLMGWHKGVTMSVSRALAVANGARLPSTDNISGHGDHWDAPDGYNHTDGPNVVHGDGGTTEMHGDSPHIDSDKG